MTDSTSVTFCALLAVTSSARRSQVGGASLDAGERVPSLCTRCPEELPGGEPPAGPGWCRPGWAHHVEHPHVPSAESAEGAGGADSPSTALSTAGGRPSPVNATTPTLPTVGASLCGSETR